MPGTPRPTRTAVLLLVVIAVLAVVATSVRSPAIGKGAAILCFALIAVLLFILPPKWAAEPGDSTVEDDDDRGRLSWPARVAWAGWMSLSSAVCFALAQLATALLPPFALALRVVGVVTLIVAVYKLFFGRAGDGADGDL